MRTARCRSPFSRVVLHSWCGARSIWIGAFTLRGSSFPQNDWHIAENAFERSGIAPQRGFPQLLFRSATWSMAGCFPLAPGVVLAGVGAAVPGNAARRAGGASAVLGAIRSSRRASPVEQLFDPKRGVGTRRSRQLTGCAGVRNTTEKSSCSRRVRSSPAHRAQRPPPRSRAGRRTRQPEDGFATILPWTTRCRGDCRRDPVSRRIRPVAGANRRSVAAGQFGAVTAQQPAVAVPRAAPADRIARGSQPPLAGGRSRGARTAVGLRGGPAEPPFGAGARRSAPGGDVGARARWTDRADRSAQRKLCGGP